MTADTIYALSSGSPPAAVAVVRISGPRADTALRALAGKLPEPRMARLATLRSEGGERLDSALVLRFPGPASATGEDVVELHLHGGRAVVDAVLRTLSSMAGLREAEPGEFTRRAFESGRIDLAEAEGLADLLEAETESQRRSALALAGGGLSRQVEAWQARLLDLAAQLEAAIDFSDVGEVGESVPQSWFAEARQLRAEWAAALARPPAERLRDGLRVVIAGPPNAGKSSLLNWLAGRQAAITSAIAGTTRDLVEAPTAIGGTPFLLVDTAGLRDSADEVERIGVARAEQSLAAADLILWLGSPGEAPAGGRTLVVQSKIDVAPRDPAADAQVSAETGEGMDRLVALLIARARALLPKAGEVALHRRHRAALAEAAAALEDALATADFVLAAEAFRTARSAIDRITGRSGVEEMLDALFSRLCVGK
ncbi:MAG: tRNA uridine-5-carboxymethylaminomethyl(34) synthesis GTPase MnmE [Alphaproteobacteria bacterium]|nr:tRNA uridine-5-carboxymethylaminomethyl(34) synthesis GTPase MnmE [Alphaproteobacteria bacterium]